MRNQEKSRKEDRVTLSEVEEPINAAAVCIPTNGFLRRSLILLVLLGFALSFSIGTKSQSLGWPQLTYVKKIWDSAPHCAFTDLRYFKGYFYCCFREGKSHSANDGYGGIRVIRSSDMDNWTPVAFFHDSRYDCRDPKLAMNIEKELMLTFTASKLNTDPNPADKMVYVSMACFSFDGVNWTKPQEMDVENQVAWRVTWNKGTAYTVGWHKKQGVRLYKSKNGLNYTKVCKFNITGFPNEGSLLFMPDGKLMALVRREELTRNFYIGTSKSPYTDWTFKEGTFFTGGPNMIMLPDSSVWACFRTFENFYPIVVLAQLTNDGMYVRLKLPSGGDCAYPGLLWYNNALWISYYSSHEDNKAKIYLAKVEFK
jgi:hypothetical protein